MSITQQRTKEKLFPTIYQAADFLRLILQLSMYLDAKAKKRMQARSELEKIALRSEGVMDR
jgi:hypothetical protein